jgi:PAS domain S-box-containing protein
VRSDGACLIAEVAIVPILGAVPPLFTGHLRDITEHKRDEETLRQAKLAAPLIT